MALSLEERVDGYLDGTLSRGEVDRFERDLAAVPEVARAFAEELLLRELLASMPPTVPPAGLEERIATAVGAVVTEDEKRANGLLPKVRSVLDGAAWTLRVPAASFAALGSAGGIARDAVTGLGQVRWMLGPFARRSEKSRQSRTKSRPLWLRILLRRR